MFPRSRMTIFQSFIAMRKTLKINKSATKRKSFKKPKTTKIPPIQAILFSFGSATNQKNNLLRSLKRDHFSYKEPVWHKLSVTHRRNVRTATVQRGTSVGATDPASCHGSKVSATTDSLIASGGNGRVSLTSWQQPSSSNEHSKDRWVSSKQKKIVV